MTNAAALRQFYRAMATANAMMTAPVAFVRVRPRLPCMPGGVGAARQAPGPLHPNSLAPVPARQAPVARRTLGAGVRGLGRPAAR